MGSTSPPTPYAKCMFLLCLYGGQLLNNGHFGFLRDLETHVRFLVALSVLIGAEIIVHKTQIRVFTSAITA